MVTLVLGGMTIQMKHVVDNNGLPYYQRSVPKDLKGRIGKSLFKIKLEPTRGNNIAAQAASLAREHDALFKALREDPTLTVSEQKIAAIALLAQYGLKQGDGNVRLQWPSIPANAQDDQPHLDPFFDAYAENKHDGIENPTEELARKILTSPLPLLLSEALNVYFSNHSRGQDVAFRKTTKAHWEKLVTLTGDIALASLDRGMAIAYMNSRLNRGLKTQTVQREMNMLSAVVNKAIIELEIPMRNPFERLTPPSLGDDAEQKMVLNKDQLSFVIKAARSANDEIRRIVLLQAATGARISEIVGLRVEDVKSLNAINYLHFKRYSDLHGKRTLKNTNSVREVPLLPFAAEAVAQQVNLSSGTWLFQRYISSEGLVKGNSADAAVNKWLKTQIPGRVRYFV